MAADERVGNSCSSVCSALLFDYNTEKIVSIRNKTVGIINRIVQLAIIGYIIGYAIIYKKGYQEFQSPYSSVTTKVKGVALTNLSGLDLYGGPFLWDTADLIIPPEENGAVFVMTNIIITPNQTQGTCPETPGLPNVNCTQDSDCKYLEPVPRGHGVKTGKCVASDKEPSKKVCGVFAWCPIEIDKLPMPGFNLSKNVPLLETVRNFTLLIKNTVQFPKFKETRRNIDEDMVDLHCEYDPVTKPLCPIFKLDTIENLAGVDFDSIAIEGGVLGVEITWNCNFDPLATHCRPKYDFRRLDRAGSQFAPGYNFRFPRYFVVDGKLYRTLLKAYGIRFVVSVVGQGGKFSVVPLFLNIGSGLGLLAIATVICDIIVLYVVKRRHLYRDKKYLNVNEEMLLQEDDPIILNESTRTDKDYDATSDSIEPKASNYKRMK